MNHEIKAYTVLTNVSFLKTGSVTTVDSCRNVSLKETWVTKLSTNGYMDIRPLADVSVCLC